MGTAATPAVERDIAIDLVKRGLLISPIVILVAGLLRGVDGALSAAIALAIVFANFLAAASLVSWAATISIKAAGIAAAAGYVVRLLVIVLALWAAARRLVDRLPGPRHHAGRRAPRPAHLGGEARDAVARRTRSQTQQIRTLGRRMTVLALEFPPIDHLTRWGDIGPGGLNKVGLIYLFAMVGDADLVPRRRFEEADGAARHPEHRGVERRLRPQPDHHADDGTRRSRLPAAADDDVLLHLLQQHHRDHPVRAVPGERSASRCRSRSR